MQENKERVEQKDEEKVSEVLENQGSLFDDDEVFTEAIVVENNLAKINPDLCVNCGICANKCRIHKL